MDKLDDRMQTMFYWMIGGFITVLISIISTLVAILLASGKISWG